MERLLITAPLIALIVFGLVVVLRLINKDDNKKTAPKKRARKPAPKKPEIEEQTLSASVQEEIGMADLLGPDIIMRDGSIINIFNVPCINVSLMTTVELMEEGKRTSRVLSTLRQGFHIIKYHRPADNSQQLRQIKATMEGVEKRLVAMQSKEKLTRPQEHERLFLINRHDILSAKHDYELENERRHGQSHVTETILCTKTPAGKNSQKTAQETSRQLLSRFNTNGYSASRSTDLEIIDSLKAYFDEPAGPKINIDPLYQIPYPATDYRAEISIALEDFDEPVEGSTGTIDQITPEVASSQKQDCSEKELYEILAELDALAGREKVIQHAV